jgi:hypothetical protein
MKRYLIARWPLALVLIVGLALVGCVETVPIGKLVQNPGKWASKPIHLQGRVVNSEGVMGKGLYRLKDGTGTIWVYTASGLPGNGSKVDTIGTVFQGFSFFGHNYGVVLREQGHKTR